MSDTSTTMINIKIETYGAIQRFLPEDLNLQCASGCSVSELIKQVVHQYPEVDQLIERCACAIGEDVVSRATQISQDSVIALLSPVAGG